MPGDDDLPAFPALMIPAAELAEARTFLSGWTLSRYVERFRAESSGRTLVPSRKTREETA